MNWKIIKKHIMTGISFMVPVVVGAGLCQALGVILGGPNVKDAVGSFAYIIYKVGNLGMSTMIIPVICAAISYSIADKPGIAPGLVVGLVSAEIKAGFLGGLVGAFLVGYVVNAMKKYIHLPDSMKGLMPILIIPFFASLICGVLMFTVLGTPIAYFMDAMTQFLANLSTGSKFVYGFVMSAGSAFDFGGPVNKVASAFCNAMLADGNGYPKVCQILASMIPPFGIAISALIAKNKYTKAEKETLKSAVPMGCVMITEGVIPIAARDLVRVVFACVTGSFVAGGLTMIWDIYSELPNGGFLAFPFFNEPMMALLALAIGSVITGVILAIIKKPVTEADEEFDDIGFEVADSELDDLNIVEVD